MAKPCDVITAGSRDQWRRCSHGDVATAAAAAVKPHGDHARAPAAEGPRDAAIAVTRTQPTRWHKNVSTLTLNTRFLNDVCPITTPFRLKRACQIRFRFHA